jgi:hypothetical protein
MHSKHMTFFLVLVFAVMSALMVGFLPACEDDDEGLKDTDIRQPGNDEDVDAFWDQFNWDELTTAEQDLWGILGWDEASWQGEADEPASESKAWSELSNDELDAAGQLGYDEASWNAG